MTDQQWEEKRKDVERAIERMKRLIAIAQVGKKIRNNDKRSA